MIEAQSPEPDPQEDSKQLGAGHGSFDGRPQDTSSIQIEESNSDQSLPIPIRRRSLLTPGIATRESSREKIVRKSLPSQSSSLLIASDKSNGATNRRNFRQTLPSQWTSSQDQLRQYYYDQSKPTSFPLDELADLETRPFSDLQPRTVTPSELDYGHIGAFKLGSLRITNGTASPAPSGHESRLFDTKFHPSSDDDEAEKGPPKPAAMEEEDSQGAIYNKGTGTFFNVQRSQVRFEFHEVSDEPPRIVETMVQIPSFSLGLSDFQPSASPRQSIVIQPPTTAYEIAQSYMQEIASSPFSFEESPLPTPQLEATSKHTAIEDNLFDDEPGSNVSFAPPVAQESVLQDSKSSTAAELPISSQQSLQKNLQDPREQLPRPLEKVDSGYSSKTSLRSLKSRRSFTEVTASIDQPTAPAVPNKSPPPTPAKTVYTRYSKEVIFASSTVQGSKSPDTEYAPATPAKDWPCQTSYGLGESLVSSQASHPPDPPRNDVPQPPCRQAPPVPAKLTSTWTGWTGPPPLPIKSIEQTQAAAKASTEVSITPEQPAPTRRQSMPFTAYVEPTRLGLKSSASDASIASATRRLQKQRPVAQPRVIVQGFAEIEPARIPPISHEVAEHLEERLKTFPTLTHTYRSVHRTNSKETLATIFSMASAEQRAEQSPVFARFQGLPPYTPSNDDIELSMDAGSTNTGPAHTEKFSFKSKILRRKADRRQSRRQSSETLQRNRSSSREAKDEEVYIADFGTVSASLGASPYELATTALTPVSSDVLYDAGFSRKMGDRQSTRGRTIGMDSQSAAQFARERSRSRENERRRAFRRQGSGGRNSSEERVPYSRFATEFAPPMPNLSHKQTQDSTLPKKTKSPPPVSIKTSRRRLSSPPPRPSRAAPSAPLDIPQVPNNENAPNEGRSQSQSHDSQWQMQQNIWHDGKRSAQEALSSARQSIDSARPRGGKSPFAQQYQQWVQGPAKRPSFEQHTYSSRSIQHLHSRPSLQDQRRTLARQSYDSSQPRREERSTARASFDSSTGRSITNPYALSQSQFYSQMRFEL